MSYPLKTTHPGSLPSAPLLVSMVPWAVDQYPVNMGQDWASLRMEVLGTCPKGLLDLLQLQNLQLHLKTDFPQEHSIEARNTGLHLLLHHPKSHLTTRLIILNRDEASSMGRCLTHR